MTAFRPAPRASSPPSLRGGRRPTRQSSSGASTTTAVPITQRPPLDRPGLRPRDDSVQTSAARVFPPPPSLRGAAGAVAIQIGASTAPAAIKGNVLHCNKFLIKLAYRTGRKSAVSYQNRSKQTSLSLRTSRPLSSLSHVPPCTELYRARPISSAKLVPGPSCSALRAISCAWGSRRAYAVSCGTSKSSMRIPAEFSAPSQFLSRWSTAGTAFSAWSLRGAAGAAAIQRSRPPLHFHERPR